MLVDFFFCLRKHQVKTSLRELLDLLNALKLHVIHADMEGFYLLSRLILVKDENHFDKFDRAFAEYFEGVQHIDLFDSVIPEDWLRKEIEKSLSPEQRAALKGNGGLDALMKTLQERLNEQKKRHQGGNKWIGTGGTSPFGAYGDNPEGVRVGQSENRNFSAVKVWDKREFKNFSSDAELGSRNIKMALRKLRKFARTGASSELDVNTTIGATAKNGGLLDIHMVPERHNAVKVLVFFDVGGSMDTHVRAVQALFSAVHTEFKYLHYFYFHNCIYDRVWQDNQRRHEQGISVWDIINKYGRDYHVIFIGDATMGPYEITYPGGSVEHWNEEPGEVWMQRLTAHFHHAIWLNPQPKAHWNYYASVNIIHKLMDRRMFPLTLDGLTAGIKSLSTGK
jgi:uncharacterized protein with von Willebrand factor type A (vWA) domain